MSKAEPGYKVGQGVSTDRATALAWMQEARESHALWAEYLRDPHCDLSQDEPQGPVGNAEHQDEWVRRYDVVLALLAEESA